MIPAGIFMVASGSGTIGPGRSTDLTSWEFTDEFSGSISFYAVCASATQFCFFGTFGEIYTSPGDPFTFTERATPSSGTCNFATCDWDGASTVIAAGGHEGGVRYIYYSTDNGDTWARVASGLDRNITVVRCIEGHYVAIGQDARVAYATDPAGPWTANNTGSGIPFNNADDAVWVTDFGGAPYITGRIVCSGRSNATSASVAAYSDDFGATWTQCTGFGTSGTGNQRSRIAQDRSGSLDNAIAVVNTGEQLFWTTGETGTSFSELANNYNTDAWGPIQSFKYFPTGLPDPITDLGIFVFLQNGWGLQIMDGDTSSTVYPVPAIDIGAAGPPTPTGNPAGPDGIAFMGSGAPPVTATIYTHVFAGG